MRDFDLAEIDTLRVHERTDADGKPVYPGRFPSAGEEVRVHTFERELPLVADLREKGAHPVGIYPEIKAAAWHQREGVDITLLVLDLLQRFGYTRHADPVYLQCFEEQELRRIRHELRCKLKLVQLIGEDSWSHEPTDFAAMRRSRGLEKLAKTVDGIGPWVNRLYRHRRRDGRIRDSRLVERAHSKGLVVHPYTYRLDDLPPGFTSFEELVRFSIQELMIDGLFTDFPGVVLELWRKMT